MLYQITFNQLKFTEKDRELEGEKNKSMIEKIII